MHSLVRKTQNLMDNKKVDFEDRGKLMEIIIAEALAIKLEIPSTPSDNINGYFISIVKLPVLKVLGEINEYCVIDIDRTVDLVYRMWSIRYGLVHTTNDITAARMLSCAIVANDRKFPGGVNITIEKYSDVYLSRFEIERTTDIDVNGSDGDES